jgi:hypothetical protein
MSKFSKADIKTLADSLRFLADKIEADKVLEMSYSVNRDIDIYPKPYTTRYHLYVKFLERVI